MNLKKNHYSRRALALLLTLVMCVGMIPTAFAAQQNSYDQTDWSAYEALLMKLEQDIVYKDGIEFPREGADLKKYLPRLCAKHPEWDGQTRWNLQLKEIRDLIHVGKDYDRRQTSNKKKRSRGGEAR